jgi:hypothetical protein
MQLRLIRDTIVSKLFNNNLLIHLDVVGRLKKMMTINTCETNMAYHL